MDRLSVCRGQSSGVLPHDTKWSDGERSMDVNECRYCCHTHERCLGSHGRGTSPDSRKIHASETMLGGKVQVALTTLPDDFTSRIDANRTVDEHHQRKTTRLNPSEASPPAIFHFIHPAIEFQVPSADPPPSASTMRGMAEELVFLRPAAMLSMHFLHQACRRFARTASVVSSWPAMISGCAAP